MSFDCEEISDICGLGDTPFICVGNVGGEFSIISLPPMWYKYTRIFKFFNEDRKLKNTECIHSM
jgi:hypothetical protein